MSATSTSASVDDGRPDWTIRGLIAAHKLIALGVVVVFAVVVAMFVAAAVGPTQTAITNSTSCTQWGSSNQSLQQSYAQQYVREHPTEGGVRILPAGVIAAIDNNCGQAFGEDVADTTSVSQALSGNF